MSSSRSILISPELEGYVKRTTARNIFASHCAKGCEDCLYKTHHNDSPCSFAKKLKDQILSEVEDPRAVIHHLGRQIIVFLEKARNEFDEMSRRFLPSETFRARQLNRKIQWMKDYFLEIQDHVFEYLDLFSISDADDETHRWTIRQVKHHLENSKPHCCKKGFHMFFGALATATELYISAFFRRAELGIGCYEVIEENTGSTSEKIQIIGSARVSSFAIETMEIIEILERGVVVFKLFYPQINDDYFIATLV
jgi:hypothetical protein